MENSKPRLIEKKLRTVEKRLVDLLTKAGYLRVVPENFPRSQHTYTSTKKSLKNFSGNSQVIP